MQPLLEQAAARVAGARAATTADADCERAKLCVMHFLACALDGQGLPWSQAVTGMVSSRSSSTAGAATMLGGRVRVAAEDAVFANAVLGQSTLAEDLHLPSLTHPGSMIVPAALAAAEEAKISGRHFLAAVLVGYDVLCGIGTALKTPAFTARGFRPSGVFGPLGAAAAVSVVLDLDAPSAASALAIAGNTSAGLREWAHAGSTDVYVQNGFAARNGFLAAQLAAHGITGPTSVLNGNAGMAKAFAGDETDWEEAARRFIDNRAVREVMFKRYPACSAVQSVLELAVRLHEEHDIDPENVEFVDVFTHRHGLMNPGCDNPGPFSSIGQAQMSNQLGVALALNGEPLDVVGYAGHSRPELARLTRKIRVTEDATFTQVYPGTSAARIEVGFTNGRVVVGRLEDLTALNDVEVISAAYRSLQKTYGSARGAEIHAALQSLERLDSVEDLLTLLREG